MLENELLSKENSQLLVEKMSKVSTIEATNDPIVNFDLGKLRP